MPSTGRHAAPRDPARRRALLPTVLLAAGGCALGGLAVLPAGARSEPTASLAAPAPAGPTPLRTRLRPLERPRALSLAATVGADRRRAPASAVAEAGALRRERASGEQASGEQASRERASRERASRERASRERAGRPPAPAPAAPVVPAPPLFVRPGVGPLTSDYGPRWGRLHAGIDLASGTGAPVSAVAAATVLSAGEEGGYGRVVRLAHGGGTTTVYAHLSEILVRPGQRVTAGTLVGREGSSGHSTGPHLHFEVRIGGVPIDPAPWLLARGVDPAQP